MNGKLPFFDIDVRISAGELDPKIASSGAANTFDFFSSGAHIFFATHYARSGLARDVRARHEIFIFARCS